MARADDGIKQVFLEAAWHVIGKVQAQEQAPGRPSAAAGATAPGCPRVKRSASLGAVGARPDGYAPAVLWPENGTCEIMSFGDLTFSAAQVQKSAFREASKVRCSDCEGGYTFDAWHRIDRAKFLALQPGERLEWKGARYRGTIVLTGQQPIGSFPCRQYHWTLKDGAKVIAEREGLFCQSGTPYSTAPEWSEVL